MLPLNCHPWSPFFVCRTASMRPLWQVMVEHRGKQWAMISNLTEEVARELSSQLNHSAKAEERILFWPEHLSSTWAIGGEDTEEETSCTT
jgi:hypothetical protein